VPLIAGLAVLWFTVIAWATRDNRDAANDGRSIDRYSNAMRVLSRRAPKAAPNRTGRYIVVPTPQVTERAGRAPLNAVERRRRTLRQLVIASGISFSGILLGGPWLVIHLVVDAALVGYVVFLRRSTLRAAEAARAERRAVLAEREARLRAAYDAAHATPSAPVATAPAATVLDLPERRRAVND
jgi:hypothetical protein